jgi:ketosteroid isomerase-like protein
MKTSLLAGILLLSLPLYSQTNSKKKMENIIEQQVRSLFEGADERNWQKSASVMSNNVLLDYSSMTGNAATLLTPEQIMAAWAAFLPGFDRTNHKLSDFTINTNGLTALAHYRGKADHFLNGGVWTVDGTYDTKLVRTNNDNWLIVEHKFNLKEQSGNTSLPQSAVQKMARQATIEQNKKVVDKFFVALETQQFEILKEVFAENGRQLNPYSPEGFPKSFDGAAAIYKQYSGLMANFGQMKFPRTIYATEDPNFFFVKFKGEIEIRAGGKYENDYLGTFKLDNGKIVEYTEYFNQLVMAKAFGIELK